MELEARLREEVERVQLEVAAAGEAARAAAAAKHAVQERVKMLVFL
jgi:hypothetical protein